MAQERPKNWRIKTAHSANKSVIVPKDGAAGIARGVKLGHFVAFPSRPILARSRHLAFKLGSGDGGRSFALASNSQACARADCCDIAPPSPVACSATVPSRGSAGWMPQSREFRLRGCGAASPWALPSPWAYAILSARAASLISPGIADGGVKARRKARRPPARGTRNKLTVQRERAQAEAAARVTKGLGADAFEGDAHAFLVMLCEDGRDPSACALRRCEGLLLIEGAAPGRRGRRQRSPGRWRMAVGGCGGACGQRFPAAPQALEGR